MKTVVGLTLAALATLVSVQAAPGRINTSKRATTVSTEEKAILPDNKPIERNEVLSDKRFSSQMVERKDAIVGERRSSIAVEERREKKFFSTPERKEYEHIERKDSTLSGKLSRYSTSEDSYRTGMAVRFQDKIDDARPFVETKPVVSKRATFDRVNRFSFRRNSDSAVTVTAAGSEAPSRDISGSSSLNPDSKSMPKEAKSSSALSNPASASGPVSPP